MKRAVRHIPDYVEKQGRTYCGRDAARVVCIDLLHDAIDDAECKACQRSDDRRSVEAYKRETRDDPEEQASW